MVNAPILVIANKIDLEPHLSVNEVITGLNLDYITDTRWSVCAISALRRTNLVELINWLHKQQNRK